MEKQLTKYTIRIFQDFEIMAESSDEALMLADDAFSDAIDNGRFLPNIEIVEEVIKEEE